MCCKGAHYVPCEKRPRHEHFLVLGHILQDDSGIRADWTQVQKSMWAAFWSNSGSPKCRSFSSESRIKLLNRTVTCCFSWKIARWPFQKSVARELASLQCRMYAFMLPCEPQMHETLDSFCRRRFRQARSVATKVGLWSLEWCERLCKWDQHLKRGERYGHICFCSISTRVLSGYSIRDPIL